MEYQLAHQLHGGVGGTGDGDGSSIFYSSDLNNNNNNDNDSSSSPISTNNNDPMQSWWESVSKARTRIHSLLSLLPSDYFDSLSSLADSDRPARSLLESPQAYAAISSSLSSVHSGSGDDPLCQWLYDTFQSSDSDLRLVVLSFVPLLSGLYLYRLHSFSTIDASTPSLAGFEAVLLAIYASETKSRSGKPLLITIPDLSQPSLYHIPRPIRYSNAANPPSSAVGVLSPPLEPQLAIKSTKRGCVVGVALGFYYKHISEMPNWSKIELCRFAASWAGEDCACALSLDPDFNHDFDEDDAASCTAFDDNNGRFIQDVGEQVGRLDIHENSKGKGSRIPLPWELLQPVLRIISHCLLAPLIAQEIRDEAAVAVRRLYARACHDLFPQGILATRSLIQPDNRSRTAPEANSSSNANTPSKARKPEVLLVSK